LKPWTPSFFLPVLVLVLFGGCSKASFYPLAGSVGGATVGSLGGPGAAAGGAALGWGLGEGAKLMEENKGLADKVKAISEGDVQELVQQQLDANMDNGFFDKMLDEVYGLLKLCLIGVILWNVVPLIYTRYVHNKTK
jgi:hypothetical protein|tara:strand:+ start:539 stop:949 length:411 start_codon:yes stop_codon:yes gene_type:complete